MWAGGKRSHPGGNPRSSNILRLDCFVAHAPRTGGSSGVHPCSPRTLGGRALFQEATSPDARSAIRGPGADAFAPGSRMALRASGNVATDHDSAHANIGSTAPHPRAPKATRGPGQTT